MVRGAAIFRSLRQAYYTSSHGDALAKLQRTRMLNASIAEVASQVWLHPGGRPSPLADGRDLPGADGHRRVGLRSANSVRSRAVRPPATAHRPSQPDSRKQPVHLRIVIADTPASAATWVLTLPARHTPAPSDTATHTPGSTSPPAHPHQRRPDMPSYGISRNVFHRWKLPIRGQRHRGPEAPIEHTSGLPDPTQ